MASIELRDAHVDIPIFSSRSRGLINSLFRYAKREQDRIDALGLHAFQVHALRGITLNIANGERVGLVGQNGAGKTTLLRVLSGAYEPTRGSVEVSGSVASLTDLTLGMDLEASGYENIRLRALYLGLSRREATGLIKDSEKFTELGRYLHLPLRVYSSGMLLRLAFAMSTAIAPDILLMDEMVGAGDAHFLSKARSRLEDLMTRASILVLASHNNEIIRTFCTRGVCVWEGQVLFDGDVEACLDFYRDHNAIPRT